MELKHIRESLEAACNPADGFGILYKRFNDTLIYAAFIKSSISASNALNLLLNIIPKTGLFQVKYKEWHNLPKPPRNLANALVWWGNKCRIKNKFTKLAGNMGTGPQYGISGAQQGAVGT